MLLLSRGVFIGKKNCSRGPEYAPSRATFVKASNGRKTDLKVAENSFQCFPRLKEFDGSL